MCLTLSSLRSRTRGLIGKSLFKKETKLQAFIGLRVQLSTGEVAPLDVAMVLCSDLTAGEVGVIDGAFGTSGKFRVDIPSM